jgi:hypothetical protein
MARTHFPAKLVGSEITRGGSPWVGDIGGRPARPMTGRSAPAVARRRTAPSTCAIVLS